MAGNHVLGVPIQNPAVPFASSMGYPLAGDFYKSVTSSAFWMHQNKISGLAGRQSSGRAAERYGWLPPQADHRLKGQGLKWVPGIFSTQMPKHPSASTLL